MHVKTLLPLQTVPRSRRSLLKPGVPKLFRVVVAFFHGALSTYIKTNSVFRLSIFFLRVSYLHNGHANLLCIVPILVYGMYRRNEYIFRLFTSDPFRGRQWETTNVINFSIKITLDRITLHSNADANIKKKKKKKKNSVVFEKNVK